MSSHDKEKSAILELFKYFQALMFDFKDVLDWKKMFLRTH